MTRQWSRRKLIKFSIITILLVLVVLEVVFRILFAIEYNGYHTSVHVQGNTLQMNDSQFVFRNRPFYVNHYKKYQFNEEGMRAAPRDAFMPEKGPDDFWVFLFGGSAMEGMGSNKDGEWLDITGIAEYSQQETIAGMLEQMLQQEMPLKKVRVFNAANSGFTVFQSRLRYEQLSEKYRMDWVISMDGENEPPVLPPDESVRQYIETRWEQSPVFRFPLNMVVPITSHSAFINKIKQVIFNLRHSGRLENIKNNDYPARKNWSSKPLGSIRFADSGPASEKAVQAFYDELKYFDSLLTARKQPHLLYIQPHIAFRDTNYMSTSERALYNYYCASYNDPFNNSFKRKILTEPDSLSLNIRQLNALHSMDDPVFIDYCHFTVEANRIIAAMIAWEILQYQVRQDDNSK